MLSMIDCLEVDVQVEKHSVTKLSQNIIRSTQMIQAIKKRIGSESAAFGTEEVSSDIA